MTPQTLFQAREEINGLQERISNLITENAELRQENLRLSQQFIQQTAETNKALASKPGRFTTVAHASAIWRLDSATGEICLIAGPAGARPAEYCHIGR
jgi:regulator of replication initiation timing